MTFKVRGTNLMKNGWTLFHLPLVPMQAIFFHEVFGDERSIKKLPQSAEYDVVLGCLDVKDSPSGTREAHSCSHSRMSIRHQAQSSQVNVLAKQWYQHLRSYLTTMLNYEWCSEQP